MTLNKSILALAVLLLTTAPLALAQGTYTQIDYPGENNATARGINTVGDVVGYYQDFADQFHGFLLSGGTYTTIDYPGSPFTYLLGINDEGQIVGFAESAGFIYNIQTREFTTVDCPAVPYTDPYAINNAGMIVGIAAKSSAAGLGFELTGSKCRLIKGPLGGDDTQVFGISTAGVAVGYDVSATNFVNFSFKGGQYRQLIVPNTPGADVSGINPAGDALVGFYSLSSGGTAGFLYQHKTLTTLQFPGATDTYALGINASGEVVGSFGGFLHGFTWTPPAATEKK